MENKDIQKKNTFKPRRKGKFNKPKSEFLHKVIDIARVTRVTKGGKRFSFRASVVLGDEKGKVGFGVAQGKDVDQSIQKAMNKAKIGMVKINMSEGTIPHETSHKFKSAKVILRPAKEGHGIKAGGPVRVVAQLTGLKNLTGKLISRTNNKINITRSAIGALKKLKSANREVAVNVIKEESKEDKK